MKIQVKRAIFKILMNKCNQCRNFKVNPLNANNFYNFAYDSSEEMRYKCTFVNLSMLMNGWHNKHATQ